ncbi:hypothetical protein QOZ80_7BG0600600 [Eleusine coracana subsp. coracana]|nr:hypothetical protein QOZ80_7BG0600600 [Eleusine coracana subsp. coracana]
MAHPTDLDKQVQQRDQRGHHGGSTEAPAGSSSSATCNPIRGVAAILDPAQVCSNLGEPELERPPLPQPRVYNVWPGKNVFFCDGRVICGPNPRGLILTAMAFVLSESTFLARIINWSSTHPTLVAVSSVILAATVTATLLLTAMRDPGIIPRNQVSPLEEAGTSTASSTPSRFTTVNGVEMRLRFCRVCKIYRPPRSSHCTVCDNCVDKFDHHCAWISQCIGLRNYRLYLLLVCSSLAFYAFILTFTMRRIRAKLDSARVGLFAGLIYFPETYALAALCFVAICFVAWLLGFNAFLVTTNKTRHERHKGRHRSSPNPYDEGTLGNIKECLFKKLPAPQVDFRAVAQPDLESMANNPCPGGACRLHPRHSDVIRSMAGVQEEEFDEGEVWDVLQDQVGMEVPRIATPPRNRRAKQKVASIEGARKRSTARLPSAPVAIPAAGGSSRSRRRGGDKPQEDEDGGEMLPPHEWLARKMERMGGVSSPASPPEACGGRSKGREMRKVRDAVLPKTAFSEQ